MSGYATYLPDQKVDTDKYVQLEHLDSTGVEYINLGYCLNSKCSVEIDFQFTQPCSDDTHVTMFGIREETAGVRTNYFMSGYSHYSDGDYFNVGYGNENNHSIRSDLNRHVIALKYENGHMSYYLDGTKIYTYQDTTFEFNRPVLLYNRNNSGTAGSINSIMNVYSFKIWDENGVLVQDLVPVQNKSTGEYGMFDTVSETFLDNKGTGNFSGDPETVTVTSRLKVNASKDITQLDYDLAECEDGWFSRYTRVEYITQNGTGARIDTGIQFKDIGYMDLDFQYDVANFTCVCGGATGSSNNYVCWYSNQLHEGRGGNVIDSGNDRIIGHRYRFISKQGTNASIAYRDGEFLKNYTSQLFSGSTAIMGLFAFGGGGYAGGTQRIYHAEFRRSENGEVLGKFIPCIRKSDSKSGMYDMVTKQFFEGIGETFYPSSKEYHFDYQKYHMYCARPIYQIDIDIADKIDGWFGDYIRCDYIESNSGAYINTGVLPTPKNFKIEVKGIQIQSRSLFGTNGPSVDEIHFTGNGPSFARYCEDVRIGNFNYMSGVHVFTLDTGKMYVDGELKTPIKDPDTIPDDPTTLPMFLFSRNKNGSSEDGGNHTIYSAKIWNNSELMRDYIPCIRRSDLKAGLYDLVGQQFYVSPNNRDFIPSSNIYEFDFVKY